MPPRVEPAPPPAENPEDPWLDDLEMEQEEPPTPEPDRGDERPRDRLTRGRDGKVIAGVCAGLGEYFGIDPVLVRLAFAVLAVSGGAGVLLYIVAWIAMPAADDRAPRRTRPTHASTPFLAGVALILIGLILLVRALVPWFDDPIVWPAMLIAIGVIILLHTGGTPAARGR
jgi:phage shock protein C